MGFFKNLGMQAASQGAAGILGGVMGAVFGRGQDRRQYHQQKRLQELQIRGQKEMSVFNQRQQLNLWNATGYDAQAKQMEKAGLNVGLMYGMGGGGGQTAAANTGQVSGGAAQRGDLNLGMGLQLALLDAQRKNIEADTENKKADTANKPIQGKNIEANTASITEGIELIKSQIKGQDAQTALTGFEARLKRLAGYITEGTLSEQMNQISWAANKTKEEWKKVEAEAYVAAKAKDDMVKLYNQQVLEAIARTAETWASKRKADAETKAIPQQLLNQTELVQGLTCSQPWQLIR